MSTPPDHRAAERRAANRRAARSARAAITVRRPDAEVWRRALRLAEGDPRRLEVLADNSVVVRNERVR